MFCMMDLINKNVKLIFKRRSRFFFLLQFSNLIAKLNVQDCRKDSIDNIIERSIPIFRIDLDTIVKIYQLGKKIFPIILFYFLNNK